MINPKIKNMKILQIGSFFFAVGVILTVFVYQAITVYEFRSEVSQDHTTLTQVVSFLNQNIQQAQATQPSQASASASTKK